MELRAYQQTARKTLQPGLADAGELAVPLLGLVGETGAIATAYKKQLRDGTANPAFKAQLREELGDALWYLAVLADLAGLDLDDVAIANLHKVADRWRPTAVDQIPYDQDYPAAERLPRRARFTFTTTIIDGRAGLSLARDGEPIGDPLTDASHVEDHYRLHDVFHIAHAAVLGWSPVMRSLLGCKRRSNPAIDLAEDGGRAIAIEEGISALIFAYASEHNYLDGKNHIDNHLLDTIRSMVAHLEVSTRRAADWEKAILAGYIAWRQLRSTNGGTLDIDMTTQTLTVIPNPPRSTTHDEGRAGPINPPEPERFRDAVRRLHAAKDAAYRNAWKKRGETISVLANIARKVDRLEAASTDAPDLPGESLLDTAVDLLVYAIKYQTYLADIDQQVAELLFGGTGDGPYSDGPAGFDQRLNELDLQQLTAPHLTPMEGSRQVLERFAELERCFPPISEPPAPPMARLEHARHLTTETVTLIAALTAEQPWLLAEFVQETTSA